MNWVHYIIQQRVVYLLLREPRLECGDGQRVVGERGLEEALYVLQQVDTAVTEVGLLLDLDTNQSVIIIIIIDILNLKTAFEKKHPYH